MSRARPAIAGAILALAVSSGLAANMGFLGDAPISRMNDQDVDIPFGTLTPHVAGTPLPAGAAYLKVDHFSSLRVSEPYRLYAVVQPISSTATAEVEPNGTLAQAKKTLTLRKFPKREHRIIVAYKGKVAKIPEHFPPIGRL